MQKGFIAMSLVYAGQTKLVWQKIVDSQSVAYVDKSGAEIEMPDTYEMSVVSGDLLEVPT